MELAGKIVAIVKTALEGNFRNRIRTVFQQVACILHPQREEITARGNMVGGSKKSGKMACGKVGNFSQLVNRDCFCKMVFHIRNRFGNIHDILHVFLFTENI